MSTFPDTLWNDMASLSALVIGDVMLDKYIWGSIDRISPEAPVPVVRVAKRDARLGGAANVALNVKALGAKAYLCAVIGDDDAGGQFIKELRENNLPEDGIITVKTRPTTTKTRIISGHQHVARVDEETERPLSDIERTAVEQRIAALMDKCQVIIFEDYDKGVVSEELINFVVALAAEKGVPVVVDPKKRNFLHYRKVQLFKPNFKELREGLNIDIAKSDTTGVGNAVRELRETLQCSAVLVTLSEYGVFGDNGERQFHQPAHIREISDVSGAGDSVISIAALAYALKLPLESISALANLAGGLVCEHSGVVPVDLDQLKQECLKLEIVPEKNS